MESGNEAEANHQVQGQPTLTSVLERSDRRLQPRVHKGCSGLGGEKHLVIGVLELERAELPDVRNHIP